VGLKVGIYAICSAPMVNLWKRSMSMTPTCARTAAYRSGRWFAHAATSSPPLLPPCEQGNTWHFNIEYLLKYFEITNT